MKLIVKNAFRDKTDHVTVYEPGTILDMNDKERAADLVERGLCAEYKGKKAAAFTLGEESPAEGIDAPEAEGDKTSAAQTEESPAPGESEGNEPKPKGKK